jgi:hypothetical protein
MRIGVGVVRCRDEKSGRREILDDLVVGILDEHAGIRRHRLIERCLPSHWVEDG